MENNNFLLPAIEPIENPIYKAGRPRVYKFDARNGRLSIRKGHEFVDITRSGESFHAIFFAYRPFQGNLFGETDDSGVQKIRKWIECYFLNQAGHVCSILFHDFSYENLSKMVGEDLFYEGLDLPMVVTKVTPVKKERTGPDGKKNTYYIASFSVESPIAEEHVFPAGVWRDDTINEGHVSLGESVNYGGNILLDSPEKTLSLEGETKEKEGNRKKAKLE